MLKGYIFFYIHAIHMPMLCHETILKCSLAVEDLAVV